MIFEKWLRVRGLSVAEAAEDLGCSRQRIYQVINNECPAGAELVRKIYDYTDGEVSLESLLFPGEAADDGGNKGSAS